MIISSILSLFLSITLFLYTYYLVTADLMLDILIILLQILRFFVGMCLHKHTHINIYIIPYFSSVMNFSAKWLKGGRSPLSTQVLDVSSLTFSTSEVTAENLHVFCTFSLFQPWPQAPSFVLPALSDCQKLHWSFDLFCPLLLRFLDSYLVKLTDWSILREKNSIGY